MAPKTPPKGRTSIKGVRSKLSDDQRDGVTNSTKERIMKYYHEYTMQKTIDKYYGGLQPQQQKSKKRLIYKWLKQEEAIVNAVASGRGNLQKNRAEGLSTVLSKDDEGMIARWVRDLRREGVPVSPFMLQTHAKEVAEDAGIPVDKFSASSSWRKRFLAKYKLSLRRKTRIGQITPDDSDDVARQFRLDVLKLIEQEEIVEIYNADQTAMNYEYLPTRTYDTTGTRTVWIHNAGAEKKRITVMLLADINGNRKTPFDVLKQGNSRRSDTQQFNRTYQNGFGRGVWAEVAPLMNKYDVEIYGNEKGWWNAELSIIFLKYHFGSRDDIGEKILLMWDDFSGHWTEAVQAYATSINVVLMKIPPGYTSVCQPADIAWMKPFKLRLRSLWVDHLQSELRSHQNRASGEKFKLKAPSRETLMEWLTTAWENLPVATIASGFNRLAIPTDKRELAAKDLQLYDMEIDGLVGKLEALHVAEDVGVDFGLHV